MPIDRVSPSLRPDGRPVGFQKWRHLLFLHWEADPEALASHLPRGLELDTHDGKAYVGVVPFTMRDVVPRWAPPVPGVSHFHELNVRTYVVHDGVPGVMFFSLDAASTVAVAAARSLWRLPYHRAAMELDARDGRVHYTSRRLFPGPKPATFDGSYRLGRAIGTAAAGTLDHFLIERYVLFTESGRKLLEGRVHHVPYPLTAVELEDVVQTMTSRLPCREGTPLVHYSAGVDVDVYALKPA